MLKIALALSALLLSAAAGAAPPPPPQPVVDPVVLLTAQPDAGATKGQLRVEWVEPSATAGQDSRDGELRIYRTGANNPGQVIPISVYRSASDMTLKFVDLNGDGFQDLVFDDVEAAHYTFSVDVFLWVPKLQRFVKSETLSQAGELSPGRRPNCVHATNTCSTNMMFFSVKELCFNQASGRWHTVSDSGCVGPDQ